MRSLAPALAVAVALAGCAGSVGPGWSPEASDAGGGGGLLGTDAATPILPPTTDAAMLPGTDAGAPPAGAAPCVEGDFNGVDPASGNCFMLFTTPTDWASAQAACAVFGPTAHLATSTSAGENAVMAQLAGLQDVFVGATDAAAETIYVWITGEPLAYVNWRSGEPNDSNGEDCMIIEGDNAGLWDDRDCLNTYWYLCERE
jgi:hypothetical protein